MAGLMSGKRMGVLVALNLTITLLLYSFHFWADFGRTEQFDIVIQRLYIVPIIMACLWFGWKAGLLVTLAAAALMVPNIMFRWDGFAGGDLNRMAQLAVFFLVSIILGKVVELQKREQARAREAERLAAIGKSLSAVAHDMKTPLVAIGGMSKLVQRHLPEDSPDRDKLEIVVKETQRLENLLKDMLDFSKPLALTCARVELGPFLKECVDLAGLTAKEGKVRIEIVTSSEVSSWHFDPSRVKQALINLILNAVQASPEGEKVVISSSLGKTGLIFDVSDCGCGIPVQEREHVFEPFFSTKKEGTGLGLPIVRKIIEAHAGRIELADGLGRGTTFRIILPCDESKGCCTAGMLAEAGIGAHASEFPFPAK